VINQRTEPPAPVEPAVWDQYSLFQPMLVSLHYGARVSAQGENLRRRVVTPTVAFTFDGTTSKPVTVRMSLEVLRKMITAASPFLGPAPGACAPKARSRR
jgi:hypothetical protein